MEWTESKPEVGSEESKTLRMGFLDFLRLSSFGNVCE